MSTKLGADSFLRIASISIACYDYLITLPVEWRMYRSSDRLKFRWSASRVLFILMRYTSIVLLAISNFGYFYHGFSKEACLKYYLVAPAFKVTQIMISQVIVGYRTWNITQRSRDMGIFLFIFGCTITVLEWYSNFEGRTPVQKPSPSDPTARTGNCSPGNSEASVPQWGFYLLAMLFDSVTILLSSCFLINSACGINSMTAVLKMLFYDGLGYFVTLTAVNIMNLILYRNSVGRDDVQSSGAAFGYTIVWIMSQNILIHIHEAAEARAERGYVFGPPRTGAGRDVGPIKDGNKSLSLDVQVKIERAVMADYDPKPRLLNLEGNDITNRNTTPHGRGQW